MLHKQQDISSWLETVDSHGQDAQTVQQPRDDDYDIEESDDDIEEADPKTENRQFHKHLDIVKDTPAYLWLRGALRNLLQTACPTDSEFSPFKQKIKAFVRRFTPTGSNIISKHRPPPSMSAIFFIHWNPFLFSNYQDYDCSHEDVLEHAITVTGTIFTAQAATVSQYVEQTWPMIGKELLSLIQRLTKRRDRPHEARLSDDTDIDLFFLDGLLRLHINGIQDAIVEAVELFAWLGAALRIPFDGKQYPDHNEPKMTTCTPHITRSTSNTGYDYQSGQDTTTILGQITFEDQIQDAVDLNGTCWRNMFQERHIVRGFPVCSRTSEQKGPEMPLNMMAALMNTKYANVFNNTTYIKGFSSMLVPTQQQNDILLWHLLFIADGGRISYLDVNLPTVAGVTSDALQTARHIVGWCSDAKLYAGTRDACHTIDRTDLPRTSGTCSLDKITISGGMYVTGGAEVLVNRREKPIRVTRNGQREKMEWLRQKYVVLWDQDDSRGWLVNGTTALLHLTLSSSKYDERMRKAFKFPWDRLKDAEAPNTADSAYDILVDQSNLDIELYSSKTEVYREVIETSRSREEVKTIKYTYALLADRVEELYMLIEKMVDHQTDALNKQGVTLRISMRKKLEGWEFKDIYCKIDPISPRILKLPAFGDGWVDLVHSLGAITLFGNGFGELTQPVGSSLCSYWQQLPAQEYYLAACVSDLRNMIELLGASKCDPIKLTGEIAWRQAPIRRCQCTATRPKHSSVALALETKSKSKRLPQTIEAFQGYAAVVLSHKGKIELERRTSSVDSGLGSSIDTSISNVTNSLPLDSLPLQSATMGSMGTPSGSSSAPDANTISSPNPNKRPNSEGEEDMSRRKRFVLSVRHLTGN